MLDRLRSPFGRIFEEAPLAWLLLPLTAGIAAAELAEPPLNVIPYLITAASALLLAAVVVGLLRLRRGRGMRQRIFLVLTMATMLVVGAMSNLLVQRRTLTEWTVGQRTWRAVVMEPPRATAKTWRMTAIVNVGDEPRKVMLSVLKTALAEPPRVGDAVEFDGEIRKPYNYYPSGADSAASSFDYARWLSRQGYSGQAFVPRSVRVLPKTAADTLKSALPRWERLRLFAFAQRNRLLAHYDAINLSADDGAILAAITLGDKSRLTKATRDTFSATGASHVLALSGLHLSILTTFLLLLLRPLRARRWSQWLMVGVSLALVWSFVLLTGSSISIVRSALMLSLMLLLGMRGEGFASLNSVVLAAFLILCFSPRSLLDVGFQMSFLAVAGIIYFYPYHQQDLLPRCPRRWRWLLDFAFVSVVAQMATAPVVACTFGRLPLLFLLTNLLVIPCTYLLLLGAPCFFALSWWPLATMLLVSALSVVVSAMTTGLEWIASLPCASIDVHLSPIVALLLYPLMLSLFALLRFRRRTYLYWSVLLAGVIVSLLAWE